MSNRIRVMALLAILTVGSPAAARDDVLHLSFKDLIASPNAKAKLDGSVKFLLAGEKTPEPLKTFATDVANRKTNSVGKTPEEACQWVALSALIGLQENAKKQGANAVIGIVSFYKKQVFSSPTQYECHDGGIMTGVALRGTYVRIP